MEYISCLSPYVGIYCKPFLVGHESGTTKDGKKYIVQILFAPPLEDCLEKKCPNPDATADIPDAAFFRNAVYNLDKGRKQVQELRQARVPTALQPVKDYLLKGLERGVEMEAARYAYLKSGDLGPMRQIWCAACVCVKSEEDLLAQLRTATPAKKNLLAGEWNNRVLACRNHPPIYPIDAWERFVKEYGLKERHRSQHID
jgi:hypothetical protein